VHTSEVSFEICTNVMPKMIPVAGRTTLDNLSGTATSTQLKRAKCGPDVASTDEDYNYEGDVPLCHRTSRSTRSKESHPPKRREAHTRHHSRRDSAQNRYDNLNTSTSAKTVRYHKCGSCSIEQRCSETF